MKAVYLVLIIVLVAASLGCVGKRQDVSTKAQTTPVGTAPPSSTSQPSGIVPGTEVLDTSNDLTTIDTMFNESSLDMSFSEVNADTFT
ncbi:Uncharacterised protein [uncultured archaeon]|nr:Uncharacterised protein [uncultured archaeon]